MGRRPFLFALACFAAAPLAHGQERADTLAALALAQHYGADVEALRRALLMSSCANGPLEKWGSQTMAWAEDDMAIVAEMAAERGIALPQAELTREICRSLKPRRYKLDGYGA